MSVPSASPLPTAKPIPRARPTPIAGVAGSPAARGASPSASSFRRPGGQSYTGRSMGFDANGHSAEDSNWRSRVAGDAGSVPKNGRGPERTVGGFEKREVRPAAPSSGSSALSVSKEKGEVKSAALSHVPCRFFKAGACTAGSSCPFSHDMGGKKEVCQWFLKGDCKFGHKCALAHVRPGEPMSMDRRNKKEQQREARERADGSKGEARSQGDDFGMSPLAGTSIPSSLSHPVPIKSAISASLQSSSMQSPSRYASSPLREPYGPPAAVVAGSPSAGFNQARPVSGAAATFASSPSRPSPLSSSFNARAGAGMSLKGSSLVASSSPLRPPSTSGAFSSSFQHSTLAAEKGGQLSASFAGKSIWARSATPDESLSPARRPITHSSRVIDDVFAEDDGHGEDLLPSSLSDLLTPTERARRMSRNDSHDSHAGSPSRTPFANPHQYVGAERLAQSANAALSQGGFLQALWSQDGGDARKSTDPADEDVAGASAAEMSFAAEPQTAAAPLRQSLLSQQRNPAQAGSRTAVAPAVDAPYLARHLMNDPSSAAARALQEHAPGQSLPGGLAVALSRMHMQPRTPSGLSEGVNGSGVPTPPSGTVPLPGARRKDDDEEALFHMDG